MLKQDLRDGMILEVRNGERYLLTNGVMRSISEFNLLEDYSEDLIDMGIKDFDIVKVYKNTKLYSLTDVFKDEFLILLWERKEIKLTDRNIEMLKALKTLGYTYIARDRDDCLFSFDGEPEKSMPVWASRSSNCHLIEKDKDIFNFITWEDTEPTKIDDLLKGVEL